MPARELYTLWPSVRALVSVLVLMNAAQYLVVVFDNVTNPSSNWDFVQGVVGGETVPPGTGFEWRFVEATWFQVALYVVIIAGEAATAAALTIAGVRGWRERSDPEGWSVAQRWTIVGVGIGLGVFFFGFITIGGNWFVMYLNESWNGLAPAFQNTVLLMLTLLVVLVVVGFDRLDR